MSEGVPLPVAQSWPWFQITDKYDKFNESKTAFKVWNSLKFFWNIKLFCENHEGCVIFWGISSVRKSFNEKFDGSR